MVSQSFKIGEQIGDKHMANKEKVAEPKKKVEGYSIKIVQNGDKYVTQITCSPLTMKVLLKILEDLYAVVLHINNDYAEDIGFLKGQFDAITMNQKSLNSNFLRMETDLFKLKNKPWWKKMLGL